jgi:hypothetical protein
MQDKDSGERASTGMRGWLGSPRARLAVVGLAAVLLVGIAVAQLNLNQQQPNSTSQPASASPATPGATQLQPPEVPLVVSVPRVRVPAAGPAAVGVPLMVSGHALGATAVATLELWDNTEIAATEQAAERSTSPALYARWKWTPTSAGEHVLFVRAIDRLGRGAQSSAVRVTVAERPESAVALLPAGAVAAVGAVPIDPSAKGPAGAYGFGVPQLEATQNGCSLTLAVNSAPAEASGLAIYGLAPMSADFSSLAASPKASTSPLKVDLTAGGSFLFAASAFDSQLEAFGPPLAVTAPPECAPPTTGWSGELWVNDGFLVTPVAVDRAYLYLTETGGAAIRLPTQMGSFVEAGSDGSLFFGDLLPPIGSTAIEMEGWGWSGGALVALGKGTYTPPAPGPGAGGGLKFGGGYNVGGGPTGPVAPAITKLWVLEKFVTTATASPGECGKEFCVLDKQALTGTIERPKPTDSEPINRDFEWSVLVPNVSQVVWQIFTYPPANTPDLNPPFVLDQDVVSVPAGQTSGKFTIDFAKYLKSGVPTVTLEAPLGQSAAPNPVFYLPGGGSAPTPTPGSGKGGNNVAQVKLTNPVPFSDRFYVRIVPLQLNVATFPSSAVTLDVVEPGGGISISLPSSGEGTNQNAYTISWTYTAPIAADAKYARCAIVTGFTSDYVKTPLHYKFQNSFDNQTPICYDSPDDDGWSPWDAFDAFVEFVADVWDYVADGVTWIKKQVVSLVLAAVPCKQIASDSACETIAAMAVDMAIAALTGMPPSLPNFDAVMAGLKGDLATLIVESAGAIPGVSTACGIADAANTIESKLKSCEEMAALAIDAAIAEMKDAASDAAGKSTGLAWPGVTWKADPRGQYHPPAFEMTITRTSDPVLPSTCTATASMQSLLKGWKFPELHQGYPKTITADVKGEPLLASSFVIPPLEPGESIKRTAWLVHPRLKWFESWRAELYWNYYEAMLNVPNFTRAWVLLTHGAELTFQVNSNCAKPSQQGPHVMTEFAWGEGP